MTAFTANTASRSSVPSRLLAQVVLSTVDSPIYICPTQSRATITHIVICNGHTTSTTFRVHHCLPGDSSALRNAQFYDSRLGAGVTVVDNTSRPMLAGESLRGKASVASVVSVSVYGMEFYA